MSNIKIAYQRFCRLRFPLPSSEQIAELEARLKVELPKDYRRFLLDYNGGVFNEPRIVPPNEDCPLDRLTFLGGIEASEPVAELGIRRSGSLTPAMFDNNDPPQIMPIGYTMMGNLIWIATEVGADDYGVIAMKIAFSDKSFHLSNGIEEFFGLLTEAPGQIPVER